MRDRRQRWNERYRSEELVWGAEPNRFLAELLGEVDARGRVLDLACGEGRNAIWLAERGFEVVAVDFSQVAIERARELADRREVKVEWICEDVTRYEPPGGTFERVIILYLQIPPADRRRTLAHAANALSPGGELVLIGHALCNLTEGVGGPQQPEVLWDPAELRSELAALGLVVERAEHLRRPVAGDRDAIDVLLRARRSET